MGFEQTPVQGVLLELDTVTLTAVDVVVAPETVTFTAVDVADMVDRHVDERCGRVAFAVDTGNELCQSVGCMEGGFATSERTEATCEPAPGTAPRCSEAETWTPLPSLRRWHYLVFAAIYLYAFPYFDAMRSAQEMPRLLLTEQIVDHGVLNLDARLGELGSGNDLSRGPDGRNYANKSPGPSFVAVPAYLLAKLFGCTTIRGAMWAVRVGAVTLPSLLLLPFLYGLSRRFTPDENARRAILAAYALASPVLPYSMLLYSHTLAAACLVGGFAAAVHLVRERPRRPLLVASLAGLLVGMAPSMDYQATLAAPIIGLYVLLCTRQRWRSVALFAAGALPPIAGLLAYHKICFGSPFRISYSLGVDTAPQEGLLGFIGPNWASLSNILFVPSNGLLVFSPWIVLTLVGAAAIVWQRRLRLRVGPEALVCAGIVTVYVVFVGSMLPYMARGGWSAGARQLVGMLPFASLLAGVGFELAGRHFATRVLATAAVLVGAVIFITAATTYPHWPDALLNPLYELSFPLLAHGYAVHSVGTWLGLHGLWSLAPIYLLAMIWCAFLLVRGVRRAALVIGLGGLLATAVVASYSRFPRTGPYANHVWSWVTATWEPHR